MKNRYHFFIIFIIEFLMVSSCKASDVFVGPLDDHVDMVGRFIVSSDSASFVYPGSKLSLRFKGDKILVRLKPKAGIYNVYIDDKPPFKLDTYSLNPGNGVYPLADGLSDGIHSLSLMLITEGYKDLPQFYGFVLSPHSTVLTCTEPKHKIEFVGNSITCGYGVEANSQSDTFSFQTENYSLSYAGLTAKRLDAEAVVVAKSGIGVYRNFGDPASGSAYVLPSFYDKSFIFNQTDWNFSSFTPELVCINLGTNDLSMGEYDLTLFKEAYFSFVRRVRLHYPNAKILLLSGSMLQDSRLNDLKSTLDAITSQLHTEGDDGIYRLDFTPQSGSLGYGADWHPSKAQQQFMSDELYSYIKTHIPGFKY